MRLKEDQYAHDIRENSADISCWDCARSWDLSLRWSSGFIQKSYTITKWKLCRTADLWGEHYLLSDPKASLSSSRYSCCSHHFFCSDGNWIGVLYPGSCLTSAVRKVPWGCLWKNATGIVWWLSSWCSSCCDRPIERKRHSLLVLLHFLTFIVGLYQRSYAWARVQNDPSSSDTRPSSSETSWFTFCYFNRPSHSLD